MRYQKAILIFFLLAIFLVLTATYADSDGDNQFDPLALYLTWQSDPTTTMTVHWHSNWKEGYRDPALQYRRESDTDWIIDIGTLDPMPFSEDRMVHTVELTRLQPGSVYEFRFGKLEAIESDPFNLMEGGFEFNPDSGIYTFRTMPSNIDEPVTFIAGADTHGPQHIERYTNMSKQAALQNPYFATIAGDIAYAEGNPERLHYWYEFFDVWKENMVTEDGHLIPILPTLGNHDVHGNEYHQRGGRSHPNRAMFITRLFATPGVPGYNVVDFGDYLSIILLDSHHANPVAGRQSRWLENVLQERQYIKNIFPVYHVQGYTAARDFDRPVESLIRNTWFPLFEEYNVRVAFEGHDHTFKRTHPIKNNQVDLDGVIYLNSAWGSSPRTPHDPDETWYLKKAGSKNCVYVITLEKDTATFRALSIDGVFFDEFSITNK